MNYGEMDTLIPLTFDGLLSIEIVDFKGIAAVMKIKGEDHSILLVSSLN